MSGDCPVCGKPYSRTYSGLDACVDGPIEDGVCAKTGGSGVRIYLHESNHQVGEGRAGPFYYVGEEGFEAWGFAFPSGYTVLEWVRESVPDDADTLTHHHQSVYHSVEDFRMVCTGRVDWGISPAHFGGGDA